MKIGICDYGIGGIGLYKAIREKHSVDIVYISDTGYTPYGKVPESELRERVIRVIQYFHNMGIEYIAVACNAASTVIPRNDTTITGVIEHGVRLVSSKKPEGIVGIVGGIRTIESGVYTRLLGEKGIETHGVPAQPLSIKIEAGDIDSPELRADIATIFEPLTNTQYILLACTHYPVIATEIQKAVPNACLLDPVPEMCNWIEHTWPALDGNGTTQWLTTGDTLQMRISAERAFDLKIDTIEKIDI